MEWISVEDRLPDVDIKSYNTNTDCLVVVNANKPTVMFMEYERAIIRGKVTFRWKWRDRISSWEVTHWMPLPEPPKIEQEDEQCKQMNHIQENLH